MIVITLQLPTLKLSFRPFLTFQTGDEDFFLGKIYGPYNEITNMANTAQVSATHKNKTFIKRM